MNTSCLTNRKRLGALLLVAAVAGVMLLTMGRGNASAQAPETGVAVTVSDFAIKPARTSVPAGSIAFGVTNAGPSPHEMLVIALKAGETSNPASHNLPIGTAGKYQGRVDEVSLDTQGRAVGEIGSDVLAAAGASGNVTFTLAPGKYALICNIPAHYAAGMWADITVSEANAPATAKPDAPRAPSTGSSNPGASNDSGSLSFVAVIMVSLSALVLLVGGGTVVARRRK